MPRISVVVPVYNAEKYLYECIDSILAQTFTDFELILVDDGSQDNSGAICDKYASEDKKITVIHQKNQGQAVSRNIGVSIAKGEWIHFVDSDDLIHPQMLEFLYSAVDETTHISIGGVVKGTAACESFLHLKNDCSFKRHPINDDELVSMYNDDYQYWIVPAKLIKKEIVQKHPFTPGRIYEDNGVVFKWINETENVSIIDEQLYFYRVNPNSTTNVDFSLKKLDLLWAFEEQVNFYKDSDFNEIKNIVYRNYAVICAGMYLRLSDNNNYTAKAKEIKKKLKTFMKKEQALIDLNEDWQFNLIYGVLYPKPIRIFFRLERYVKKLKRL